MKRLPLATAALVLAIASVYGVELAAGVEPSCLAHGLSPAHPALASATASLFLHASWAHLLGEQLEASRRARQPQPQQLPPFVEAPQPQPAQQPEAAQPVAEPLPHSNGAPPQQRSWGPPPDPWGRVA